MNVWKEVIQIQILNKYFAKFCDCIDFYLENNLGALTLLFCFTSFFLRDSENKVKKYSRKRQSAGSKIFHPKPATLTLIPHS